MPWENEHIVEDGLVRIKVWNSDFPDDVQLAYIVDPQKQIVIFYPRDTVYPLKKITFQGFKSLPTILHENGYFKSGIQYYFGKKLSEINVTNLTIVLKGEPSVRKSGSGHVMIMPYREVEQLIERFKSITAQTRFDKNKAAADTFSSLYPKKYKQKKVSSSIRFSRFFANLDSAMASEMNADQLEKLLEFSAKVIEKKYVSSKHRHNLFKAAKLKFDNVALEEVIKLFEEMLSSPHTESDWGKFLKNNLYLVESRYKDVIPELNLMLGGNRNVDFGLIDTHGFLDLFEIKKPDTPLLAKKQDRGNWYWSTEAIKAITQAEKYLFNATEKGANLTKDIEREYKIIANVNRPRAVLIMGNNNQLDADKSKIDDLRVLRSSLKNIEIITYDELLQRLKNQKEKSYSVK